MNLLRDCDAILLRKLGLVAPFEAAQLRVGRNNQVFLVTDSSKTKVILKRFFVHEKDPRNRFRHETEFLKYAAAVASGFAPRLLVASEKDQVVLLECIEGEPFTENPRPEHLRRALEFIRQINPSDREKRAMHLPLAADACFSARDHLNLLSRRMERLGNISFASAREFVTSRLRPAAASLLVRLEADGWCHDDSPDGRILSPSDFGFHNALHSGTRVCFLDFEYAGWDGIGKMMADFFTQPRFPADRSFLESFEEGLAACLSTRALESFRRSRETLLSIHALKWCAILLNDFIPVDGARRAFSGSQREESEQLQRAINYFENSKTQM